MTPRDFVYWLQGFFEISGAKTMTEDQVKMVRNHLNLVFKESIDLPDPNGELQAMHDGKQMKLNKPNKPWGDYDLGVRC